MAYDLLLKNGRIVDGSGMPSFHGDVAIRGGKIVELGKLGGPATRVIDAAGPAANLRIGFHIRHLRPGSIASRHGG